MFLLEGTAVPPDGSEANTEAKEMQMPDLKDVTEEVTRAAKDAIYVVIGLGALGVQRAQVRRRELMKRLAEPRGDVTGRIEDVRGEITKQVKTIDEALEKVIGRLEASLEPIEDRLPTQAREVVKQVRTVSREAREQLRSIVLGNAA